MIFETRSSNILFYGLLTLVILFTGLFIYQAASFYKQHPECDYRNVCQGKKNVGDYYLKGEVFVSCLQDDGTIVSKQLPEGCR